jgi:hypothetical protein
MQTPAETVGDVANTAEAIEAFLIGIGSRSGIALGDMARIDAAELADAERAFDACIEAGTIGARIRPRRKVGIGEQIVTREPAHDALVDPEDDALELAGGGGR